MLEGSCCWYEDRTPTRKDKNDEMLTGKVELKAELFDRMEDFRMKRKI